MVFLRKKIWLPVVSAALLGLTACGGGGDGGVDSSGIRTNEGIGAGGGAGSGGVIGDLEPPSYEAVSFAAGRLASIDDAFAAALDVAYFAHYADTAGGDWSYMDPDDEEEIVTDPGLPVGTWNIEFLVYNSCVNTVSGRIEWKRTLEINSRVKYYLPSAESDENDCMAVIEASDRDDLLSDADYQRVLAAGDRESGYAHYWLGATTGIWVRKKDIEIHAGFYDGTPLVDGTEFSVEIDRVSRLATNLPLEYMLGDYRATVRRASVEVTGERLQVRTTGVAVVSLDDIRFVGRAMEIESFIFSRQRSCGVFWCDDEHLVGTGMLGGEASGAKYSFAIDSESPLYRGSRWPRLAAGKVTVSDSSDHTAMITYDEDSVAVHYEDVVMVKSWDEICAQLGCFD